MSLPGGKYLARGMSNKAELINNSLILVCREAVSVKIIATIRGKLDGKYTKKEIGKYMLNFNAGSDDVPEEIITLGLAMSYDMG